MILRNRNRNQPGTRDLNPMAFTIRIQGVDAPRARTRNRAWS
jgi:hypothetical protein